MSAAKKRRHRATRAHAPGQGVGLRETMHELEDAHVRRLEARNSLRTAERDVRRALGRLRDLTASKRASAPRSAYQPRREQVPDPDEQ